MHPQASVPQSQAPLRRSYVALFILSVLLSACSTLAPKSDIEKSPNDNRQYRAITLDNRLQVVLISDPTTDRAAAALDVGVGSREDPKDFEGLAHFTEHMLFLGTQKYPAPGEYQDFISQHGGSHNAFTAYEDTNFFFDVQPEFLEPALDRFAQQFSAPLFTAEYVQREKNAVHSEFSASIRDDSRRYYSALKEVLNPDHPFTGFSVGNLKTLQDHPDQSVRDAMLTFYNRYYSANLMRLVIYGKDDLNTLERWAREKFTPIPDRDRSVPKVTAPIVKPGSLPALLTVKPIMEKRSLMLLFPLPPIRDDYAAKPGYYLSNLLGHEGEGSLLSWLKKKGWADSLSSGMALDNPEESALSVSITLTQEGLAHYQDVIQDVFAYIKLIREQGIDRWRFDEQAALLDISYRFQETATPIRYTSALASRMQDYPVAEILKAPYRMDDYDPALYRALLDRLTPDNLLISLMAPNVPTDRESAWYKAAYGFRKLSSTEQQQLTQAPAEADLHLPAANPFIPQSLAMVTEPSMDKPVRLEINPKLEAWYSRDTHYGTPRADFYVSVRSAVANASPKDTVMTELYVRMAQDALNEFAYPASLAGLDYRIYKHVRGFTLRIEGYSDKQKVLLDQILATLSQLQLKQDRFNVFYDDLRRELANVQQAKPYERGISELRKLMLEPYWNEKEQLDALAEVNLDSMKAFVPKLLSNISVVTMAHGNLEEQAARAMNQSVLAKLVEPANYQEVPRSQVVQLKPGSNWVEPLQLPHNDTGFTWLFQGPDRSYRSRAGYALMTQILASAYYQDIRTERQLGYIVFATPMAMLKVPGLGFIVQSPNATPEALYEASAKFLSTFEQQLPTMPPALFEQQKQAVIANLLETPKTLGDRSDQYWTEIDERNEQFDSLQQLAHAVSQFSLPELVAFYHQQLVEQPTSLLIYSRGESFPKLDKLWIPKGFNRVVDKSSLVRTNGLFSAE